MRILTIFGTRPEAIKMCPLVRELRRREGFDVSVCVTGQHREMLREVLDVFGIEPDWNLAVMKKEQTLTELCARMLSALPSVLDEAKPDLVLVHGDTASAFAASLCCFYRRIALGHVEAGLRTGRMDAPFPEELHRCAIDLVANYRFAPTEAAGKRLVAEGKDPSTVFVTGNTVIDALKMTIRADYTHPILEEGSPFLFLTAHRRENHGEPLARIFRAARRILDAHPDLRLLCPMHPSPAVTGAANEILGSHPRALLTEPLSFTDCHNLLSRARLILTDSGGIQEEATALGRPVLVLREVTERPEGVDAGFLHLVGTEEDAIVTAAERALSRAPTEAPPALRETVYGTGDACRQIADILENACRVSVFSGTEKMQ